MTISLPILRNALVFCGLFFIAFAKAQFAVDQLKFLPISEDGSKKPITSIVKDDRGFIWIGTRGSGLYRYDGVHFESFKQVWGDSTSINSNQIATVYLDRNKNLWVGTDAGLNLFDREQETFIAIKPDFLAKGEFYTVSSIAEDHEGNLIVGSYAKGIFKVNTTNYSTIPVALSKPLQTARFYTNAVEVGLYGDFYAGTSIGLLKYDHKAKHLTLVAKEGLHTENKSSLTRSIESLHKDNDHNLWIGTWKEGLLKMDLNSNSGAYKTFPITKEKVFCISSRKNTIFLGTENDGLLVVNSQGDLIKHYLEDTTTKESIKSNSIWSIYLDNEERVWLGYYNQGVDLYNPLQSKFGTIDAFSRQSNANQSIPITDIIRDKDGLLRISTFNEVFIYNPATKAFRDFNSNLPVKNPFGTDIGIESLFVDSNNNFWVGTWANGVYFLKNGSQNFVNYNQQTTQGALKTNTIRGFAEDSKGRVWLASFLSGLHYYDPSTQTFHHYENKSFTTSGLSNSDVKTLIIDSYDHIWVGSTNGLFKVKEVSPQNFYAQNMKPKMERVQENHPSLHNILSLYEGTDGTIWIGTEGVGLLRYDRKGDMFYNQNELQEIREMTVNGIIEDHENNLWICGDLGVTKINLASNEVTTFSTYDGLLSPYARNGVVAQSNAGDLYFGNQLGVNYINPTDYQTNKIEPILYLTDFKLFNTSVRPQSTDSVLKKSIAETDTIHLQYDQNFFTLDFIGINYTRGEKNEYAYMLDGFDEKWNYVGSNNSATYTGLDAGNYTFKVKAANNDGVWTQEPLQLFISVSPPWWKSTLAYLLYILFALVSFSLLFLLLQKRFKEKQAVILERNQRAQEDALQQLKLKFFTNISHEFRTPLTLIINPIKDLVEKEKKKLPKRVNEKLKIIHKNSYRLSLLINELMDFRKLQSNKLQIIPKEIEVISTLKNIKQFFKEEKKKRAIELTLETELEALKVQIDPGMFEKIIFNILSNAFKVTPDGGSIMIKLHKNDENLPNVTFKHSGSFVVSIKDSGSGIDQREYNKIFNRFYQVSTNNKEYYGSTGIGLEMVKDYITLHQGSIKVESEIGKGATFIMTFPIIEAPSYGAIMEKPTASGGTKRRHHYPKDFKNDQRIEIDMDSPIDKSYSVLIVEDNIELQEYVKLELMDLYETQVASNGKEAYDIALKQQPDIIITDVVMPIMDGIKLCKKIKSTIATSHIPVIILSAKAMVEDRIKGVDSGADGYLSKPFDMDLLKAMIQQKILSRKGLLEKYTKSSATPPPNEEITPTTLDDVFLKRVLYLINEHIDDQNLNVENLAEQLRLSRSQLYRKIKVLTGSSASEFLRKVRLEKAKELLQSEYNYNISEVTYKVGFSSPSYFTKCFKKEFGYLPTEEDIQPKNLEKDNFR